MNDDKPFYHHNGCPACRFAGNHYYPPGGGKPRPADLYLCKDTVIIRFGDDGQDYFSAHLDAAMQLAFVSTNAIMWRSAIRQLLDKGILEREVFCEHAIQLFRY